VTEFEKIYKTYFTDVYLYVLKISKNESIAEEITSETFFKALQSIDNFRGECDIRVWLCQIAKNCYYSYYRKQKNYEDLDSVNEMDLAVCNDSCIDEIADRDDALKIYSILQDIPDPYKEVFSLRILGEMSFKQIGSVFKKTENWACVTYHRARNMIRKKMEEL
jgi:RNA polymerase sigma-70 factor (ECF subfamily)